MTITNRQAIDIGLDTDVLMGPDIDGDVAAFLRERVTSAFPVITTDHAFIHEGIAYTWSGVTPQVSSAASYNLVFTTPADTAATITITAATANADVTFTAVTKGVAGNLVSVAFTDVGATTSVTVDGYAIDVGIDLGTTTATNVVAMVTAATAAAALVTAAYEGTGAGKVGAAAATFLEGGADDAPYIHFKPAGVTALGGPVTVTLRSGATITGGTTGTAYNRNRLSSNTAEVVVKTAATATGGTAIDTLYIPTTTAGVNRVGGSTSAAEEYVLAKGTTYNLRFLAGGNSTIGYSLFWYEEEEA